ncbi:MAG: hypothetical protein MJE12_05920 [Alphaproteobacteria bacterium]|nr:hypothetical protein [Alphaproteobacteria bacterium]
MAGRYRSKGRQWTKLRPTIEELQETIGRVYALALVADLELDLKSPPHVDGADYANLVASSVTAILVDMETKEIVLSASDVRHKPIFKPGGFLSTRRIKEVLITTYKNAASAAVKKLQTRMATRKASDEFDRHMVTGTLFPGPTAQGLFKLKPWSSKISSICALPAQCAGTGVCSKLTGLVSAVATSALSNAGKLVLPPIGWNYWADRSTNLIALNLVQPRGGMFEEPLSFKLPAEAAEIKSLVEVYVSNPRINRASRQSADSRVWSGTRYDKALLKLHRYQTDPEDCGKAAVPKAVLRAEGTHASIVSAGYTTPSNEVVRLYALGAILDATKKLEKEIRNHAK